MDFTAKLIEVREPVTGEGKNGPWKRQEYIFETDNQYARKICVQVWGDRAINDPSIMVVGNLLKVEFDLESREFNNRWYTDVRAWRISRAENAAQNPGGVSQPDFSGAPQAAPAAPQAAASTASVTPDFPAAAPSDAADDLPF